MDTIFFSYSRADSSFVLKLAKDLRDAGVNIWLDQLDIAPGSHWDASIEKALHTSKTLLIILSSTSVASENVMDEVSYALEEGKKVIPILLSNCETPFRLRRLQRIDFTGDYQKGFNDLLVSIGAKESDRIKSIETISETIKKANAPKSEPVIVSQTDKPASKKGIFITAGVIILAFAILGISKMGGKDKKPGSETASVQSAATVDAKVVIDTSVYYFIQNRANNKLMTITGGDENTDESPQMVVLDSAQLDGLNSKKIQIYDDDGSIMLFAENGTRFLVVGENGFIVKNTDEKAESWTVGNTFRFINYVDGYFQIVTLYKNDYVLGLHDFSSTDPEGQKIEIMKNDKSLETQWRLVATGEKVYETSTPE